MKRTRICDLLGIEYPIIQGGMLWLATAELVAAVSNVGAFGVNIPLDLPYAGTLMALGAEGVQLGTRFVVVEENIAHQNYKKAIIDAGDTDTVITCRSILPTRSLKTDFARTLLELEKSGAAPESIQDFIGYRSNWTAQIKGNLNGGEAYCGESAGLIKEILPVEEVIRQLIEEYVTVLKRFD